MPANRLLLALQIARRTLAARFARSGWFADFYEACPMALIVEAAGGAASTGLARILDLPGETLHQRLPVIIGAADDVEQIVRAHSEGRACDEMELDSSARSASDVQLPRTYQPNQRWNPDLTSRPAVIESDALEAKAPGKSSIEG